MSALLALDIGNSRVKWALFDETRCQAMGHLATRDFQSDATTSYDFEPPLSALLLHPTGAACALAPERAQLPSPGPLDPLALAAVSQIAMSSVAGAAVETRLLQRLHELGLPALPVWRVRSSAAALGVRNGYAVPERLGSDRWSALIGARARSSEATVVVMAGTATTVDALDANGHFLGGYILPGLRLMPKSLYERTAGIRPDDGSWAEFPDRTADAVTSGVLAASAGAVAGMVMSLRAQGSGKPVRTLVSGGNGPVLLERMHALGLEPEYQRDLVLEGVARLFRAAQAAGF